MTAVANRTPTRLELERAARAALQALQRARMLGDRLTADLAESNLNQLIDRLKRDPK